ncbi:MAG: RNase adapter RapZ [Rhodospirillales bacterium]|nr:RNase adapter RapZ [Rhodospirillales bacterium]
MTEETNDRHLVLLTGLSGAGRSTALKALEDEGYDAIDNLPLHLVEMLLDETDNVRLAIVVDVRQRSFDVDAFLAMSDRLRTRPRLSVTVVFLTCDSDGLQRRFTETRRPHPLAGNGTVADGIETEQALMKPVMALADLVVDTSAMNSAALRRHVGEHLRFDPTPRLSVFVMSFSYRMGIPGNADLVFDVRFLSNPHYVDELRHKTGKDAEVARFIESDDRFADFFDRFGGLISDLLPAYTAEGKRYLTIAIGCTGGRHRSVFVAERLAPLLSEGGRRVALQHRELTS